MNKHFAIIAFMVSAVASATDAHELPSVDNQSTDNPSTIAFLEQDSSTPTNQVACIVEKTLQDSEEKKNASWAHRLLRAMITAVLAKENEPIRKAIKKSKLQKYLDMLVCRSQK